MTLRKSLIPSLPLWAWPFIYVILFMGLRLFLSPNLGTDDVEAAVFAQGWHLGYNPKQPPLYTWLLLSLYRIFGPSLLAHTLLRYGLLFLAFLGFGRCVRLLGISGDIRKLAPLTFPLLFPIGWGAQLGFTHTLLLTAALFWLLAAFLAFTEKPSPFQALELGIALAFGFMSKYNFILFPASLALSALSLPKYRRALLHPYAFMAAFFAILACSPYIWWLALHMPEPGANTASPYMPPSLPIRGVALFDLVLSALSFLSPLILLLPFMGRRFFIEPLPSPEENPEQALLLRTILVSLSLLAGGIVLGFIPDVKARYLHPVLLPALPLILMRMAQVSPSQKAMRHFRNAGIFIIFFMALAIIIQGLSEPRWCKNCRWHTNMPALAQTIRQTDFPEGSIVAADEHIAGNMRILFPDARVWTPAYAKNLAWPEQSPCLGIRRSMDNTGTSYNATLPMLRYPQRKSHFAWIISPSCDADLLQWVTEPLPAPPPAKAGT
ncbi:MAG TPA: hypothetical protein DCW68_01965 [Rhodospirillaceae bacterium]|nr:MAG: hypothetical protein A2018_04930 [Alphaproteobacteria bacterium GWF2_58_20]HAU28861.1 hypothetical protein [Rhodospirillaceae bacterium]